VAAIAQQARVTLKVTPIGKEGISSAGAPRASARSGAAAPELARLVRQSLADTEALARPLQHIAHGRHLHVYRPPGAAGATAGRTVAAHASAGACHGPGHRRQPPAARSASTADHAYASESRRSGPGREGRRRLPGQLTRAGGGPARGGHPTGCAGPAVGRAQPQVLQCQRRRRTAGGTVQGDRSSARKRAGWMG
jgi:hypothetical protein